MSSDIEKEPLSRQQKKSKETKARIFHAAKTILQKQGYDQLSIKNICDEAGVSNGSFYHHFKTKDDLLSYYIEEQPSINPDLLDMPEDADEAKIGIIHVSTRSQRHDASGPEDAGRHPRQAGGARSQGVHRHRQR